MKRDWVWKTVVLLGFMTLAPWCFAAGKSGEKWADPRLTVKEGLVIWLDAARLPEARKVMGQGDLQNGGKIEVWPDGSGQGRHVRQKEARGQPTYEVRDGFHAVRFKGRDTHLRLEEPGRSYREITVFLVAVPYSNPEWFSGFLALSAADKNDYQTGLNVDQATGNAQRFEVLNVEGVGSGGMKNLLTDSFDFGTLLRVCITSTPGTSGTRVSVNGKEQGARDRTGDAAIRMDRLVVGARFYTNGGPPQVRSFLDGDIAEVIVYDRVLKNEEKTQVDKYLTEKYGKVPRLRPPAGAIEGKPLVRVKNGPAVQVLVPGFVVKRLPVELPNINNVLYRRDGKLVALAYDGNVYLLSDTDGDGLEDKAEQFWENDGRIRAPIGMDLTPPGYRHGEGVLVAAKGRCSLLVDTDRDGKAEKEIVVAEGWKELPHGVDALGIAVDPADGSIYFGRGTTSFTAPYLLDEKGNAAYSLAGEFGAILRISPDLKTREIIATGIRFPVGMRFNQRGDLFCTDQEGATWLPNGNPFDELLHIEKGRHYGFPPRHPKYLPGVIDEPSTYDYTPQHQSTCGLNFNEPVSGGPIFGPAWWKSDLFVAGYSRGKLYRTRLVKTASGYVAQNQILACLNALTCDVCVSPRGELVVATHSGGPDWGSGPSGKGSLYKIVYQNQDLPQPVMAWPHTPWEVRVAFDRPLEPDHLAGVSSSLAIEYGRYVAAADRFEALWPGYQAVQDQLRAPRYELPVQAIQVMPDRRTLILSTAEHPEAASYAVTLPGLGRRATSNAAEIAQVPETDLQYNLCGVEASWRAKPDGSTSTIWLPHLDFQVAQSLTAQSSDHERFWASCLTPGELTLRTLLDLKDMLRPAVQPGSTIDYRWPAEEVTLTITSKTPFSVTRGDAPVAAQGSRGGYRAIVTHAGGRRIPLDIVLATTDQESKLSISWHTKEDPQPRPLPLSRMLLPWSPAERLEKPPLAATEVPELKGGNWARGRKVFFSEEGLCSKCHAVGGEGSRIGPDLTNLPHRDYESVLRDISEPSFAINPDYISQTVVLQDGRILSGVVRTEAENLIVADTKGQVTAIAPGDVETIKPAATSIMPQGVPKQLGPDKLRDLLTFLLTQPPRLTDYGPAQPPEPRTRREVDAVLAGAPSQAELLRPLRIVLVAGRKDHGPGEHDYPAWQKVWEGLLSMAEATSVETASAWPTPEQLKTADVLVFYQQGTWTPERAKDMDAFLGRGGGAVYIHYAVDGGADAPGFAKRIGLAWQGGRSKFRHGPLDLGFAPTSNHPIARNIGKVHLHDESYWQLLGNPDQITLLASGREDNEEQPLFWTMEPGKGRVFVSIPGHFSWTFDDPLFRVLLLRGIAWSAGEPVDRFNELVIPGARIKN